MTSGLGDDVAMVSKKLVRAWEDAYRKYGAASETTVRSRTVDGATAWEMAHASWAVASAWRGIASNRGLVWWALAAVESAAEAFEDQARVFSGIAAVELLEELAATVKERAARYRGRLRAWHPGTGDPFLLLIVDELADVIAYQTDKQLRERAARAVQTITSQGRAPGVCVLGLLQDPRKEVISFRHLFSTRVAMRLDEKAQVDMVLGDGVRERGAAAHEISENTPGVTWVKEDGRREPVRTRAFHVTDTDLDALVEYVTGVAVHRADVLPFPGQEREGGAAA
jgi:S-DNA-T family DNA segregation ATPase FtsK/SpoIIIE